MHIIIIIYILLWARFFFVLVWVSFWPLLLWASCWTFLRASFRPFPQPEGAKKDPHGQHLGTNIARFILGSLWGITFSFLAYGRRHVLEPFLVSSWPLSSRDWWHLSPLFPPPFFGQHSLQWLWSNCYLNFSNCSVKSRLQCDHPLRACKPANCDAFWSFGCACWMLGRWPRIISFLALPPLRPCRRPPFWHALTVTGLGPSPRCYGWHVCVNFCWLGIWFCVLTVNMNPLNCFTDLSGSTCLSDPKCLHTCSKHWPIHAFFVGRAPLLRSSFFGGRCCRRCIGRGPFSARFFLGRRLLQIQLPF